jgi:hypothetical protein
MKTITTERLIILNGGQHIFSPHRIKLRIGDQAAGPYLLVSGKNDEPDTAGGETGHEFFLESAEQIDQFAEICKQMLMEAQGTC